MSDIIDRSQKAQGILKDASLAPWQRPGRAMIALSGLMLSDLNEKSLKEVEKNLAKVNQVISHYDVLTELDYEKLTESEISELSRNIRSTTELCIISESNRIMQELDSSVRTLPVTAIQEVRKHQDIFVPLLKEAITQDIAKIQHDGEFMPGQTSFFAAFLLTELEVDDAFPIILEGLQLPDDGPSQLFGDGIHEFTTQATALFSRGDTKKLNEIVGDPHVNIYVRWSTAKAYKYLVRDDLISRQEAIDALHYLFQTCIERVEPELLAALAVELGQLAAENSLELIRKAYEDGLVDSWIVHLEYIEEKIAGGEETVRESLESCGPTGIPNTIEELSRWAAFREDRGVSSSAKTANLTQDESPDLTSFSDESTSSTTNIRVDERIGRNSPCPCGSGKKFKKCCRGQL